MTHEIVGLAPSGSMGSGYNLEAFERGLAAEAAFHRAGRGHDRHRAILSRHRAPFLPLATYRHDLSFMLRAARTQSHSTVVGRR